MGTPDKSHKMLLANNDEFAEVFSVLALNNKVKLDPNRLREAATEYEHLEHGKPMELRRDVVKVYDGFALGICICGFENQTSIDIGMPVRVMGYDWTRYRYQLKNALPLNQDTRIAPVFSHVLNFSYTHKWNWPNSLRDLVNLPPELEVFFQDYKISVTNLAWLTPKERELLTGDFRAYVEALCEMRTTGKITGIKQPIKHIDAMLALLAATTNQPSLELFDKTGFQEGKTTMCEIMDRWVSEIKAEGYADGEKAGYADGEKAGYASGEKAGYANGKKAGYASGKINGKKESAVKTCKDLGKSKSETVAYLAKSLHLSMAEAAQSVEEHWGSDAS